MSVLVSPGISVSITNESYYIPAAAPTVPLIFLATRADKTQADGITAAAGALEHSVVRTITSLNQAVSTYGVPYFRTDNTGAALHGDARNEYGLFALNQALTVLSRVYVVRADVDLADDDIITYNYDTPVYNGTGTGTLSAIDLNESLVQAELWTLVAENTGTIATFNTIVGGSYTNGTYNNVPLVYQISGVGTGATANITVAGGAVTAVTVVSGGTNYDTTDQLTADASYLSDGTGDGSGTETLATYDSLVGGTGHLNGTYNNVTLVSGITGLGATANITVAGGIVTGVTIVSRGTGYTVGETLTSPAFITLAGGIGFSINVATIFDGVGFTVLVATLAPTTFTVDGFLSGPQANATVGVPYNNGLLAFQITGGLTPFVTGDAWTFNVTATTTPATNPLGANDPAKRLTIVTALQAEINSNPDVRSEIFEYNLILCPGYHETASELLNLNLAINEEAFVIADCPFQKTPEDTATWSLTIERQASQNIAYYYPNALASNLDGADVFCAASGVALKTYAYSDSVAEVWYPPAGFRRGVVTGVTDIGYVTGTLGNATTFVSTPLNQGQRDVLYEFNKNINPIPFFPGQGIVVFGQKTSAALASALDRVNVMRMLIMIKRDIRKASLAYLFELNDRITQDSIKQMIDSYLNDILLRRGLYDYVVICDASNNTPTRIDRNELWIDLAIKPAKSVEFIYIPIRVVSTGASI